MDGRFLQYVTIFITSILVLYVSFLTFKQDKFENETNSAWQDRRPSSVWCTLGPSKERLCKFKNICFDPAFHEFQFLLKEESIISGLESSEDWMNIALSTVLGHNAFYMKISLMKPGNKNLRNFMHVSSPTFLVHRFKSDNIMHVLHDDLIPLHFTYESVSHAGFNFSQHASLAFVDMYKSSVTDEWYNLYSKRRIFFLSKLNSTICFADAYGGLLRSTLWFNYGFGQLQGPFVNHHFNVRGIRNFVEHNLPLWNRQSEMPKDTLTNFNKVVVIVRNQSRRILNLDALVRAISKAHNVSYPDKQLQITMLDLAVHNLTFVLSQVNDAKLLIGMHGAGMILSLFLPPWSGVVEMFPFGINPNHVSFLKALTHQSNKYPIHYETWINAERKNTFPGAQTNPLLGQISHLPYETQKEIKVMSEVPPVYCCHDPAYLYYMYHDTLISEGIYHSIFSAFSKTLKYSKDEARTELIYPSSLSSFNCEVNEDVMTLHWGDISNQPELRRLWFQVTVKNGNTIWVKNETDSHIREFKLHLGTVQAEVHGWIQPYNDNIGGHTLHSRCVFK